MRLDGRSRSGAFTLIELLVVIAIIALLMSIMMPALGMVKKQAQAAICRGNLKHWGLIWKMFTDDNNDTFLEELDWICPLEPYYKDTKIFLCPAAKKRGFVDADSNSALGDKSHAWMDTWECENSRKQRGELILGSYGMNYWCSHDTSGDRDNYDDVVRATLWTRTTLKGISLAPMFSDSINKGFCALPFDDPPTYDGEPYWGGTDIHEMRSVCIDRHPAHTVNILFGDYSARKAGLKELWVVKWHRNWPRNTSGEIEPLPVWPPWMTTFTEP